MMKCGGTYLPSTPCVPPPRAAVSSGRLNVRGPVALSGTSMDGNRTRTDRRASGMQAYRLGMVGVRALACEADLSLWTVYQHCEMNRASRILDDQWRRCLYSLCYL